jgi:hypothetical protein
VSSNSEIVHARSAAAINIADHWNRPPPAADVIALNNLVQAYACFADAGATELLATLFTEDAEWDGTHLRYGTASGPTAIADLVCAHVDPAAPMMHLPGPPLLVAAHDGDVLGLTWCTATRWRDGVARPVIYFSYEDVFHRDDSGAWRFHRRRLQAAAPRHD